MSEKTITTPSKQSQRDLQEYWESLPPEKKARLVQLAELIAEDVRLERTLKEGKLKPH
jgi:hypothetical protein